MIKVFKNLIFSPFLAAAIYPVLYLYADFGWLALSLKKISSATVFVVLLLFYQILALQLFT